MNRFGVLAAGHDRFGVGQYRVVDRTHRAQSRIFNHKTATRLAAEANKTEKNLAEWSQEPALSCNVPIEQLDAEGRRLQEVSR